MIVGVTYPIPKQFMDRFFKEGKDVFIKPATVWKELKPSGSAPREYGCFWGVVFEVCCVDWVSGFFFP